MHRLLILGGADTHVKLVTAAKNMGIYTIVTDYLEHSPAKLIADEAWMIDVMDVERIVDRCKEEHIDAVLSSHLDPCQRPYYKICHELGVPCYIDSCEQINILTDKRLFKERCRQFGVGVIEEFTLDAISENDFPVIVKPSSGRGSKGQSLCYNRESLIGALDKARQASYDDDYIIEKYVGNSNHFAMTYFFVNGKPYLIRTSDRYMGPENQGYERIGIGTVSPSFYANQYIKEAEVAVLKMYESLKIKNGPVFMQGVVVNGKILFYDPGYRFPGSDYDEIIADEVKFDAMKMLIEFALTGNMDNAYNTLDETIATINGKSAMVLYPVISEGTIDRITGIELLHSLSDVKKYTIRHRVGEKILPTRDIQQRVAEINILSKNRETLRETVEKIFDVIEVYDDNGNSMLKNNIAISDIK